MSDNLKEGKYMDKNKNNDHRWDVFKTLATVIVSVLGLFTIGTVISININVFPEKNLTSSSSTTEDLKTSKNENSILEYNDSSNASLEVDDSSYAPPKDDFSQGVVGENCGDTIVIDEVYTLYKRTMTQLECIESNFFPYGYQSPDVTMVGYGERIVVKNYFDADDNIDCNNIYFSANFYNEKNELLEYDDYPFCAYLSTEADRIEMIFSIKEPIKSGRYSCEFIIYENAAKELDSIYITFDVI